MRKTFDEISDDNLTDISIYEKPDEFTKKFFNLKINEKNYFPIEKSIKAKKVLINDLLKKRLLRPKDYIISRNNKMRPYFNTEKTKKIKKDIKFSKLYEKIRFGSLDYLNKYSYSNSTHNKDKINLNKKSLLNSQNFNFCLGSVAGNNKYFFSHKKEKGIKDKKFNKTVLGTFGSRKIENMNNNNKDIEKDKEKDVLNKNYFNSDISNILVDNYDSNNKNILFKKVSKELSINSELTTPRSNNFFDNKIKRVIDDYSWGKKNIKSTKDINISQHSINENINKEEKKTNSIIKEKKNKNEINISEKSQLKKLILNYLNDNINEKRKANSYRKKEQNIKHNYYYRNTFLPISNEKLLKNFQKYTILMDKENDNHTLNINDGVNTEQIHNIFIKNKKLEMEKKIKKKFCEFGSKTISSLMTDINSDQIHLNNKLFKIIDKSNKKIKKEKQLDKVLEIILDRKLKKKKKIKAKQIYIDAMDGKKLLEERNKLRFMMRFADLIKNMKDEIALSYTKNILDSNTKLQNEFNIPELAEYRRLKREKNLERHRNMRNRLMSKNVEIEMRLKVNEIEKDILYNRYENIFKKNKMLNNENKYKNSNSIKDDKNYHNIDNILNDFEKLLNE